MSDTAAPVIDMTQFLLANRVKLFSTAPAAAVGGYNALYTVPNGKVWYLRAASIQMTTGAGVTCSATIMVQPADRDIAGSALVLSPMVSAAASQVRFAAAPYLDLILGSGTTLGVYVGDLVGAPTMNGSFYAAELTGA